MIVIEIREEGSDAPDKRQSQSQPKAAVKPPEWTAVVHSFLDEYGLDPYEFRVYAHIARRTGGKTKGVCFASQKNIADMCQMSTRRVQQALKVLITANLVTQTKRKGKTDEYHITPASEWASKDELLRIQRDVLGKVESVALDEL